MKISLLRFGLMVCLTLELLYAATFEDVEKKSGLSHQKLLNGDIKERQKLLALLDGQSEEGGYICYSTFLFLLSKNNKWAQEFFETLPEKKDENSRNLYLGLLAGFINTQKLSYMNAYFDNLITGGEITSENKKGACVLTLVTLIPEKPSLFINYLEKFYKSVHSAQLGIAAKASLVLYKKSETREEIKKIFLHVLKDNAFDDSFWIFLGNLDTGELNDICSFLYEQTEEFFKKSAYPLSKLILQSDPTGQNFFKKLSEEDNKINEEVLLTLSGIFSYFESDWYKKKMESFQQSKSFYKERISAEYFSYNLIKKPASFSSEEDRFPYEEFIKKTTLYTKFLAHHQILLDMNQLEFYSNKSSLTKDEKDKHLSRNLSYGLKVKNKVLTLKSHTEEILDVIEKQVAIDRQDLPKELNSKTLVKTVEVPFMLKRFNRISQFSSSIIKESIFNYYSRVKDNEELFHEMISDLLHTSEPVQKELYWSELYPLLYRIYRNDSSTEAVLVLRGLRNHVEKDSIKLSKIIFPIDLYNHILYQSDVSFNFL